MNRKSLKTKIAVLEDELRTAHTVAECVCVSQAIDDTERQLEETMKKTTTPTPISLFAYVAGLSTTDVDIAIHDMRVRTLDGDSPALIAHWAAIAGRFELCRLNRVEMSEADQMSIRAVS
jgi:hypothetical protein